MTGTLGSSRHLYRILYVVHFKIDINCVGYTFPELITFFYSVPKLSLLTASEVLYSSKFASIFFFHFFISVQRHEPL